MLLRFLMLKFKKEWLCLNEIARANRLSSEETVLLFAIREVEAGDKNNEYKLQHVQNTSLAVQAESMAVQIQKGEYIYQQYLKGSLSFLPLAPKEEPIDFVQFLGTYLMANGGHRKDQKWVVDVKQKMNEITEEFEGVKK